MQCSLNNHRSLEKPHNRLLNTPSSKILHQKRKKMLNYLTIALVFRIILYFKKILLDNQLFTCRNLQKWRVPCFK